MLICIDVYIYIYTYMQTCMYICILMCVSRHSQLAITYQPFSTGSLCVQLGTSSWRQSALMDTAMVWLGGMSSKQEGEQRGEQEGTPNNNGCAQKGVEQTRRRTKEGKTKTRTVPMCPPQLRSLHSLLAISILTFFTKWWSPEAGFWSTSSLPRFWIGILFHDSTYLSNLGLLGLLGSLPHWETP